MTTILYIAEIILYTILAINIGYLLLFALASKFYRRRNYPNTPKHNKFAVIMSQYSERGEGKYDLHLVSFLVYAYAVHIGDSRCFVLNITLDYRLE